MRSRCGVGAGGAAQADRRGRSAALDARWGAVIVPAWRGPAGIAAAAPRSRGVCHATDCTRTASDADHRRLSVVTARANIRTARALSFDRTADGAAAGRSSAAATGGAEAGRAAADSDGDGQSGGRSAARGDRARTLARRHRASLGHGEGDAGEHASRAFAARLGARAGLPLRDRQRGELRRRTALHRLALEAADHRRALQGRRGALFRHLPAEQLLQRARHRHLPDRKLPAIQSDAAATGHADGAGGAALRRGTDLAQRGLRAWAGDERDGVSGTAHARKDRRRAADGGCVAGAAGAGGTMGTGALTGR